MQEYYCDKLWSSSNTTKVTKSRTVWAGHVARIGEVKSVLRFVRTPDGKRPPRRPTHVWWHNIKVNLQDGACERTDWIHLAQVRGEWRDVNTVMNSRVTKKNLGNFFSIWGRIILSAKPLINRIRVTSSKYQLSRFAHELLRCCTNTTQHAGQHSTKSRSRHLTLRNLKSTTPNFVTISVPFRSHENVSTLHDPFWQPTPQDRRRTGAR
jgi:hypothetical protein